MKSSFTLVAFSRRVQALRHERGLSQQALAEQAGIPQSLLGRYEQGKSEPRANSVVSLADALDVSADLLLCRVPLGGQAQQEVSS